MLEKLKNWISNNSNNLNSIAELNEQIKKLKEYGESLENAISLDLSEFTTNEIKNIMG